jgi:myo-inositol 2-dehydrogenase/D-chiro-inositol 1-dehydrogenase
MSQAIASSAAAASRRQFLKQSGTVFAAGAAASQLVFPGGVHAAGSGTLKVGLIGCGGRGTGAASNALKADTNVKLVAMGDAFPDRLQTSLENLEKVAKGKVDVAQEKRFTGFDAYKQVIASGVDVVILATPPHFRPMHLKAAVDAGVHVFCEKPVAVDAPGVRSVLATVEEAKQKNLSIVSGLCWRYDHGVRETMKRVLDGAIGEIVTIQENYNTSGLWNHGRKPEWSDMEWQLRNWLYFTWLSGDFNTEQHVHSLDKGSWAMLDSPPLRATGLGGRQVRVEEDYGNIFDHFAVVYEYESGAKMFSFCRQQNGCSNDTSDYFIGTKGRANILKNTIEGETSWKFEGSKPSMYQVEHDELFASIRSGEAINNGHYMAVSTMLAILGRMASYTGKTITWKDAINSQEDLSPPSYEFGPLPVPPVAKPGITQFL